MLHVAQHSVAEDSLARLRQVADTAVQPFMAVGVLRWALAGEDIEVGFPAAAWLTGEVFSIYVF